MISFLKKYNERLFKVFKKEVLVFIFFGVIAYFFAYEDYYILIGGVLFLILIQVVFFVIEQFIQNVTYNHTTPEEIEIDHEDFEIINHSRAYYIEEHKEKGVIKMPLIIKRKHLFLYKNIFTPWAFGAIILAEKSIRLIKKGNRIILKVILDDAKYGLYTSQAKTYLDNKIQPFYHKKNLQELQKLDKFLIGQSEEPEIELDIYPLRWASGGVLPIVNYKKEGEKEKEEKWVALFFRGKEPMGWNIANGASESEEEFVNVRKIIYREFYEELMVLEKAPIFNEKNKKDSFFEKFQNSFFDFINWIFSNEVLKRQQKVDSNTQFLFKIPLNDEGKTMKSEKFQKEFRKLRAKHDGMIIDSGSHKDVNHFNTDFEVEISHGKRKSTCRNIVFSINNSECGIEVISLIEFDLDTGNYLLDGEMTSIANSKDQYLIRRPVIMIKLDFLKEYFSMHPEQFENKSDSINLDKIPADQFILFDADLKLRQNRLNYLKKQQTLNLITISETQEMERLDQWDNDYREVFEKFGNTTNNQKDIKRSSNNKKHDELTMLCPVTWKTLKYSFDNGRL